MILITSFFMLKSSEGHPVTYQKCPFMVQRNLLQLIASGSCSFHCPLHHLGASAELADSCLSHMLFNSSFSALSVPIHPLSYCILVWNSIPHSYSLFRTQYKATSPSSLSLIPLSQTESPLRCHSPSSLITWASYTISSVRY